MIIRPGWAPNSRRQKLFLSCPAFELLAHGNRGGGKSEVLLADFLQDVGTGLGSAWRGIIFRREYKDLDDIVERSKRMIPRLFPGARFRESAAQLDWIFPGGERLVFRAAKKRQDILRFLGHEWPWQGWEELCSWKENDIYLDMMSCCRSSDSEVARRARIRSNTNPWGPGAQWVKRRFIDTVREGRIFSDRVEVDQAGGGKQFVTITRAHLQLMFADNITLASADPTYQAKIQPSDPEKRKAWIQGSWDLHVGGMFAGVWQSDAHIITPFSIPSNWYVDRSHDWGWTSPHATIWWAESSGEEVEILPGVPYAFPRGTLFGVVEHYGGGWDPDRPHLGNRDSDAAIAAAIAQTDKALLRRWQTHVRPGPADNQIFSGNGQRTIADRYEDEGVRFIESDKSPGSRSAGWKAIFDRLEATAPFALGEIMEEPGLLFFDNCRHTVRTLPSLERSEKDPDDIEDDQEDHLPDCVRYRVRRKEGGTEMHKRAA